jgi:hypothetical protein
MGADLGVCSNSEQTRIAAVPYWQDHDADLASGDWTSKADEHASLSDRFDRATDTTMSSCRWQHARI